MPHVQPYQSTLWLEDRESSIRVVTPRRRSAIVVVSAYTLLLWWIQWMVGANVSWSNPWIAGLSGIVSTLLTIFVVIVAIILILFIPYIWLLMAISRQEIRIDGSSITIRRAVKIGRLVLGIDLAKNYAADHIRNLRTYPPAFTWVGALAFDYGADTVRFGADMSEAEARQVLAVVRKRFPALVEAGQGGALGVCSST